MIVRRSQFYCFFSHATEPDRLELSPDKPSRHDRSISALDPAAESARWRRQNDCDDDDVLDCGTFLTAGDIRSLGKSFSVSPTSVNVLLKLVRSHARSSGLALTLAEVSALVVLVSALVLEIKSLKEQLSAARSALSEQQMPDRIGHLRAVEEQSLEESEATTLVELCETILSPGDYSNISNILDKRGSSLGVDAPNVASIGARSQRDLGRVTALLIRQILRTAKAGASDEAGLFQLVTHQREMEEVQNAAELTRAEIMANPLVSTISKSYRIAMRTKNTRLTKQVLSLLVVQPLLCDSDIVDICSQPADITPGAVVRVQDSDGKGRQHRLARVVSVDGGEGASAETPSADRTEANFSVRYLDQSTVTELAKQRHATVAQAAAAAASAAARADQSAEEHDAPLPGLMEENVLRSRIKVTDAVYRTMYQIREAKLHARSNFPGAIVEKSTWSRVKISYERALHLARSLRPGGGFVVHADASNRNIAKGVRFHRLVKRKKHFKQLNRTLKALGLTPLSWGFFIRYASSKEFEDTTEENCTCPYCRDLGFKTFAELRSILEDIVLLEKLPALGAVGPGNASIPADLIVSLNKRIDDFERFAKSDYARLIQEQHSNAWLCSRFALTAQYNPHFYEPCEHPNGAGEVGGRPMALAEELGRPPRRVGSNADWNSECDLCDSGGKMLLCNDCDVVAHEKCIKATCNDYDPGDSEEHTGWGYKACTSLHDVRWYDSDDAQVNELQWIIRDAERVIERHSFITPSPDALDLSAADNGAISRSPAPPTKRSRHAAASTAPAAGAASESSRDVDAEDEMPPGEYADPDDDEPEAEETSNGVWLLRAPAR